MKGNVNGVPACRHVPQLPCCWDTTGHSLCREHLGTLFIRPRFVTLESLTPPGQFCHGVARQADEHLPGRYAGTPHGLRRRLMGGGNILNPPMAFSSLSGVAPCSGPAADLRPSRRPHARPNSWPLALPRAKLCGSVISLPTCWAKNSKSTSNVTISRRST